MFKEDSNNNYNREGSNYNYSNKMFVKSISQKMSEVSHVLSDCCQSVKSMKNAEIQEILPFCSQILSEMNDIVMLVAAEGQHKQLVDEIASYDDNLWWDSSHDNNLYTDEEDSNRDAMSDVAWSSSSSDISADSNTTYVDSEAEERKLKDEIFIWTMLDVLDRAAPNDVFSKVKHIRRRKRRLRKMIHRDLRMIWRHATEILTPAPVSVPSHIPEVNWSQVNKRFLANVPEPRDFPVQGCSPDPNVYKPRVEVTGYGSQISHKPQFECYHPFGSELGFMTQYGVIPVGDLSIHGHTWDKSLGTWVLKAEYPNQHIKKDAREEAHKKTRQKSRRKKEPH